MSSLLGEATVIENALTFEIVRTFQSVPLVDSYVKVYAEELFPDNDAEDMAFSLVPDPVNPLVKKMVSIIQVGIPAVQEQEYTNDVSTILTFTYPITFDLSVIGKWVGADNVDWPFDNSSQFFKAVYFNSRKAFKIRQLKGQDPQPNRTFGFDNVVHNFLQLDSASITPNEEDKSLLHTGDMSLVIQVTGVTT